MITVSKKLTLLSIALCAVALTGCANKGSKSGSGSRDGYASAEGIEGGAQFASEDGQGMNGGDGLAKRVYYYGFDRYDVQPNDYNSVEAHAGYLASNPNKKVRVEGHTDDRGSREYNIGLGERRSKSVMDIMASRGVAPNQVKVISYGKEKPAARGASEDAYSQNRRAELVYEE